MVFPDACRSGCVGISGRVLHADTRARHAAAEGLRRGPGILDFEQPLGQRCQASECGDCCSRVEGSSRVSGTQLHGLSLTV